MGVRQSARHSALRRRAPLGAADLDYGAAFQRFVYSRGAFPGTCARVSLLPLRREKIPGRDVVLHLARAWI